MNIAIFGPFGLRPKSTMRRRALPLGKALAVRGHRVTVIIPPWDWPGDAGREWLVRAALDAQSESDRQGVEYCRLKDSGRYD